MTTRTPQLMAGLILLLAIGWLAPGPAWAQTPEQDDLQSTMTLQLQNFGIDQVIKFLGDTTGQPIIKANDVNAQITVTSPKPVTKAKALDLIYEALIMQGVYVVEMEDELRIVKAEALKAMQFELIDNTMDIQSMPDSNRIYQYVYILRNISANDIENNLEDLIPATSLTIDDDVDQVMLVDKLSNLKRYDRFIRALDSDNGVAKDIEYFPLVNVSATEMAGLLAAVLPGASPNRRANNLGSYVLEDYTLIPDDRQNMLVVSGPREMMSDIREFIEKFDQPSPPDVRNRTVDVKHVDPDILASRLGTLFRTRGRITAADEVQIVSYGESGKLIVRSSQKNFDLIQELLAELDTADAESRETRTYVIQHLQAAEMGEQLELLYQEQQGSMQSYYDYLLASQRSSSTSQEPRFVPMVRSNSLMVLAKPKDFKFIEDMIEELDKPVDISTFEPQIYQIRNTDATELVSILTELFNGEETTANNLNWWIGESTETQPSAFDSLFGDIRFVVDRVTNRVVVLTSHPENYELVERMIEKFDKFDPTSADVMVYELKYANAKILADSLNNLFSEGRMDQNQQNQNQNNQNQNQNNQNQNNERFDGETYYRELRDMDSSDYVRPWQVAQREQNLTEERPINTMIGQIRIVPDQRSAKLLITAPPMYFAPIRTMIEELDKPEPQVSIQARILEINRGDERRIGIRWTPDPSQIDASELENAVLGLGQMGFLDSFGGSSNGPRDVSTDNSFGGIDRSIATTLSPGDSILSANINLALLIQLLLKNSESRVLSEPDITVNNNEPGRLFVGSRFPFRSGSTSFDTGNTTTNIDYYPVGVDISILPQINADGEIVLSINLRNSRIRDERISGDLVEDVTQFQTEVAMDSGQTIVIGGIVTQSQVDIVRRVPILGYIPVVKWFFSKSDKEEITRELVVFITPNVLNNKADLEILRERMELKLNLNNDPFFNDQTGEPPSDSGEDGEL